MKTASNNHDSNELKTLPAALGEFVSLTPTALLEKQAPVFTLALAHEIRNPLANINLALEILQSSLQNDEDKACLDIIGRGSVRISNLINNLLANYEAKEVPLQITQVNQLLNEIVTLLKDRLMLKNIIVRKHFTRQECNVLVNKEQVMIAIINIIVNAIDAMPSSRGELKITTRCLKGTGIIEIEDNGIGISNENLKKIFKPYFTNKPGGMGLGLSTALTSLLSNHARVKVYSEEGKGSKFILFLELAAEEVGKV